MHPEQAKAHDKVAWSTPSVVELTTRATAGGNTPGPLEGFPLNQSFSCDAAS